MIETCETCGTALSAGRADGLCPVCFFASAMEPERTDHGGCIRIPGLAVYGEIARGGTGVVYRAEQEEPRRTVALKILSPQWAGQEAVRERFRREARSMAALSHPDILPVYAVGETDGLPWFTMKFAGGGALAHRIRDYRGRPAEAAALTAQLARALAFAHERGVLHRDIKPGNILFDADGHAYLADFGLAKHLVDDRGTHALTLDSEVLGTPNYLAPEVASGHPGATIAGDIYSLGAVLYELLSGRPPHEAANLPALLRRVADEQPVPLADINASAPRDLRAICEKAMAKEPERRYRTARDFADDLRRFLAGDEVEARELGWWESFRHWCRRHPVVATLLVIVALLVVALSATSVYAHAGRTRAELNLRKSLLAEAEGIRRSRLPRFRAHALERVAAAASNGESEEMRAERRSQAIAALAFPELRLNATPKADSGWELAAVSAGLEYCAWTKAGGDGWQVTRTSDGKVLGRSAAPGHPWRISRDGRWVALNRDEDWQLWNLSESEGRLEASVPGTPDDISPDGRFAAYYYDQRPGETAGEIRDTAGGEIRLRLSYSSPTIKMRFSPDGELCAIAPSFYVNHTNFPYSVRLYRTSDGSMVREISSGLANCVWSMAWSRDGRLLAASERGGAAYVWDTATGNTVHIFRGTGANLWRMAFSPDDRYLATLSDDGLLSVFDTVGGQPVVRGYAYWTEKTTTFAWSASEPDLFGPVKVDGHVTFLRLTPGAWSTFRAPDSHGSGLALAVSPGDDRLAVGDSRNARLWDISGSRPRLVQTFANNLWNSFAFSSDRRWLYGCGEAGVVRWELSGGLVNETSRARLIEGYSHSTVALDRSGSVLAAETADIPANVLLHSPAGPGPKRIQVPSQGVERVSITPDGALLGAAGDVGLRLWNTASGELVFHENRPAVWTSFSADGHLAVVAIETGSGGGIRYEVWSVDERRRLVTLPTKPVGRQEARAVFSDDGRWLATGHAFGRVALWTVGSWNDSAILESPNGQPPLRLTFDHAGKRLFISSNWGVVEEWNLQALQDGLKKIGLGW